ncbi:MAG: TetR/AcrR family transcriptional regulator [Planctomycetota bacterium]|jgi:hypothetical protein
MKSNTKNPGKNRVQKRAKRTRKKLKDAALDIFSEQSIDATTVQDITEKADVGKGTKKPMSAKGRSISILKIRKKSLLRW